MIRKALEIIKEELQLFLDMKDPENLRSALVVLSNILDQEGKPAYNTSASESTNHFLVGTLVNIQEERHLRPPPSFREIPGPELVRQNPEVNLNLYVLFTAFSTQYETSLGLISDVIKYFQAKPYFTQSNTPKLDPNISRIAIDLNTMTFEQQNYMWGLMGAKYMPSVVYKLRAFSLSDEHITDRGKPIKEINISD